MNTTQHRSAAFKWQGFLCTSLAFVHLFGTAAVPLPFVVAAAAASDAKTGPLEIKGRGGIGGGVSSELLFEQLEVPHNDEDHDKKKGRGSWETAGGSYERIWDMFAGGSHNRDDERVNGVATMEYVHEGSSGGSEGALKLKGTIESEEIEGADASRQLIHHLAGYGYFLEAAKVVVRPLVGDYAENGKHTSNSSLFSMLGLLVYLFSLVLSVATVDSSSSLEKNMKRSRKSKATPRRHTRVYCFKSFIIVCTISLAAASFFPLRVFGHKSTDVTSGETILGDAFNSNTEVLKNKKLAAQEVDRAPDNAIKSFILDDDMKELRQISEGLLRGSSPKDVDATGIISKVKGLAESYLKSMKDVQIHFQNGNPEKAAAAAKAIVGYDPSVLVEAGKDVKKTFDHDHTLPSLANVPDAALAPFIQPQIFDQLVSETEGFLNILEEVNLDSRPSSKSKGKRADHEPNQYKGFRFDRQSKPFGYESPKYGSHQSSPEFHYNDILKHAFKGHHSLDTFAKKIVRKQHQHKARLGKIGLSRISSLFENDDVIMAKHQSRQEALGETCPATCDDTNWECNCQNLFACVNDMTKYDLAVLIAGGFIDEDSESDDFGNFTVSAGKLNLFDADEGVNEKLTRIQNLTDVDDAESIVFYGNCALVLEELFTACDPEKAECTNPNTESFQVSTEQVCSVVNTPTKLLFEVIGDEFDGFDDEQAGAKCEPLSFDVCRDFVAEFDRLYESSNETNPMRKNSNSLYDEDTQNIFQHTQFPVEYWYPQDDRGIAHRSFSFTHYYVVCGTGGFCNGVQLKPVSDHELYAVRCCSDTDLDTTDNPNHWKKNTGCSIYGESDIPNDLDCHSQATFAEAKDICEVNGARLCTKDELIGECAKSTGCGFDANLVWSSTVAVAGSSMVIVNPATGKALGLAGTSCDPAPGAPNTHYGPRVEVQDYNPYNSRQHFALEGNGKIRSEGCRWSDGGTLYLTPEDVTSTGLGDTNQCTGGSTLILRRGDSRFTQIWKVGVDGTIAIDLDCTVYQTENLVISAIDDDDLNHYENSYFSFVNPASGLALSVQGTGCSMDSVTTVRTYNKDDGNQKFKLVKMGNKFLVESKACYGKEGLFLSAFNCGELKPQLTLGPKKFCIKVVTASCSNCAGKVNVFVDSGNGRGYVLETTNVDKEYNKGQQVMKKCYDGLEGVQVHGPSGNAWGGNIYLSLDDENSWTPFVCLDCTGSSNTMPIAVSGDGTDFGWSTRCKNGATCTLVPPEEIQLNRLWDINDGKLELDGCGRVASINTATYPPADSTQVRVLPDGDSWSQIWTAISDSAILTTEDGGSNQEWTASFVSPPYNYALLPQQSFPGAVDTDGCLSSTNDPEVSKAAMHYCDASMSLLIGSQTSLGTLRAIADVVKANGLDYMPGSCCFDSPTSNSLYLGVEFDPNLMICQNTGPMHLGISEESCDSAGGKWFRTPCITLKEAIDARPFKYNIDSPIPGSCQDELLQVNTAYVEASTFNPDFLFSNDEQGCNEFCRSLPDYINQIAMMTGGSTTSIETCVCLYPGGGVPSTDLLPRYANRSPPKFSLIDSTNSMALGISSGYDCSSNEITIEAQDHVNSVRHQFHLTYDHRLSSAACPEKVLSADCATGMVMLSNATYGQMETALNQQWNFNNDGTITNSDPSCSGVQLSATKDDISSLESLYFSLVNPATSLVMGVKDGGSCVDGNDITLQKAVPGSPNQQFYYEEDSGEIVSVLCPDLVIGENLAPSSAPSMAPSILNTSSTPTNPFIPDDVCNHKNLQLKTRATANDAWLFNDDGSIESSTCSGKVIDIETGGKLSARAGAAMILSEHSEDRFSIYQKWTRSHLKLSILSGPYSLVNPASGLAIGTENVDCTNGMALKAQADDHTNSTQQFYLGSAGAIHSAKCPGMVIGIADGAAPTCLETRLTLQTATGEDFTKWVFNSDGSIESVLCPGLTIMPSTIVRKVRVHREGTPVLSLAEVQVFDYSNANMALNKNATQSSTHKEIRSASMAVDGILNDFTHTAENEENPWWQVDLEEDVEVSLVKIWNRNDCCKERLSNSIVSLLDQQDNVLATYRIGDVSSIREIEISLTDFTWITDIKLQSQAHTDSQVWRKVNTRLLAANEPAWTQNWDINFVEEYNTDHFLHKYDVVCGSGGYTCPNSVQIQESFRDQLYAVRCCASTGCSPGSSPDCLSSTFAEAKEICETNGARLCTKEELLSGCTINTGCGFNNVLTWSSTPSLPARLQNMTCYEPSDAFSPSFEDFAKDLVIDDAADEDQCRHTREQLGYELDHPFDTEIRDAFNDHLCNGEEFTLVDHMAEGLSEPPTFAQVEFEAPEYPDDPGLSFDKLPTHDPIETPGKIGSFDKLETLKLAVKALELAEKGTKWIYDKVKETKCELLTRNAVPMVQPVGVIAGNGYGGEVYIGVPFVGCTVGDKVMKTVTKVLYYMTMVAHKVGSAMYSKELVKPGDEWDMYYYAQGTFKSLKTFDSWNFNALETINKNIFKQHSEMREHLQDRHQAMTTDIVEFLEQSTNVISGYFTLQTDWLHNNLCVIFKEISGATNCDGTEDNLLGLVGLSLWDKMLRIEAQGESLTKEIHMARSIGEDEEAGDGTQSILQVGTKARDLESIHTKIDAVEAKVDAVEAKVDAVEGKVDVVDASIQEVKDKVIVIEISMQEVKEQMKTMENMMSKMMSMLAAKEE